ncbi:MAG: hypothetical protein AABX54_05670 [Nanoarchaeota archaeon]
MKKQKIDIYHLLIGIIYLAISWIMYSKWGIGMALLLILLAFSFIMASIFKKSKKHEGSKFILFSYLFVILSFTFPFIVSLYKKDITNALFVFLMGMIFFILYLREIKSMKKRLRRKR